MVCSNSLRSNDLLNAVGTLKQEMSILDSLIIKAAEQTQISAGNSLAVDRQKFSDYVTNFLRSHPLITVVEKEFVDFNFEIPTIVASGPLTTTQLQTQLQTLLGNKSFYFFDAVAPIITKDSINMKIAFRKNSYDKGESSDYINCPMTKEEYERFYNELIRGELAISHLEGEKDFQYFEGCMPIEALAKRGFHTLLFGPLKPKGLDKVDGTKNYAVVQLRQDNAKDSLYNLVGFQTNLKWPEQKRIFSLIPGLEKAQFVRYGVMHKNNFINSPKLLNLGLQLKSHPNIFFAGQIIGVEGYVESAATGIIAAINLDRFLKSKEFLIPSDETVLGALINYVLKSSPTTFQPMKANWGIVAELQGFSKRKGKEAKKQKYSQRAIFKIQKYLIDTDEKVT